MNYMNVLYHQIYCAIYENIKKQECIPVGCVPPAAVTVTRGGGWGRVGGGGLHTNTHTPLDQAPPDQAPPRPGTPGSRPPGPGTTQQQTPLDQAPPDQAPQGPGTPWQQTLPWTRHPPAADPPGPGTP